MSLSPSLLTVLKDIALIVVLAAAIGGLIYVGYQWGSDKEAVALKNSVIAQQTIDIQAQKTLQAQIDTKQARIDELSSQLLQAQQHVKVVTIPVIEKVHDQLIAQPSTLVCQLPPSVTQEINQNSATLNPLFGDSTK